MATVNGQQNGSNVHDLVDNHNENDEPSIENSLTSLKITSNGFKNPSGFSLPELYKYSLQFYKEKSGKAVHLSYGDKCKLVALNQQVSNGPFNPSTSEPLGTFDVIGRDRRLAWQGLGTINKDETMQEFINMLDQLTPTYAPFIEAVWADHLEKQRLRKEESERKLEEEEESERLEMEKQQLEEEEIKHEETKRQIQDALNQQTFGQFKIYAEQQYPGNPEEQGVLIRQLQDEHYLQYMQQVYQQGTTFNEQEIESEEVETEQSDDKIETEEISDAGQSMSEIEPQTDDEVDESVIAASMWTRRDIKEFKESIRQEGADAVIKVGHGETVTVRVPTHQDGNCLFWEFSTDFYDIGFGIHFEWTTDTSNVVSIHITETDDDDEDDEDEEEPITTDDIERLGMPSSDKPPQSVIIPVYRRDCHEEVYAGSHPYPGQGVYLLKFDNSYSMWRSKMLYYRVYYTR